MACPPLPDIGQLFTIMCKTARDHSILVPGVYLYWRGLIAATNQFGAQAV